MNLFRTSAEIREVLKQSAVKALLEVTQPLENALEFLRREAPARYLLPSVEHLVMSQVTAAALFEALWTLDRKNASEVAHAIGENAGLRFADSLWEWLVSIQQIPGDEAALLTLWMEIDSSANWGQFDFSKYERQIVIHVDNSFLIRSDATPSHDYCSFLEGYVFGFMWVSLKELHHWLKGSSSTTIDAAILSPGATRKCAGRRCSFELHTGPDEMSGAFEELVTARHMIRAQPQLIDAQVAPLRRSLESGFKTKFGLRPSDRWEHGMRAARGVLTYDPFPSLVKRALSTHSELSGQVHDNPRGSLAIDQVHHLAREVAYILKDLEAAQIGQDKRRRIQDQVSRSQTGQPPQPSEPPVES